MRLIKLALEGYRPLLINGVNRFEITPKEVHQIIIGTNGTGKSSVMREMTPLPAVRANYIKGGSKVTEWEHRGSHYVLSSEFKSTNHHSFIKDGEELNQGGTASVQNILVKQHFNIDNKIHELLSDKIVFTKMTPQQRREWIPRLSGGDLGYAISLHNKLKSLLRDRSGVIRHLKGRMVEVSNSLLSDEELAKLEETANTIKEEVTLALRAEEKGVQPYHVLEDSLESLERRITELARSMLSKRIKVPHSIRSHEELLLEIEDKTQTLKANEAVLEHLNEELLRVSDIVNTLKKTGGIEDLEGSILKLEEEERALQGSVKMFHDIADAKHVANNTREALPAIRTLLGTIKDNSDRKFNRNSLIEAREEISRLENVVERAKIKLSQVIEKKEHLLNAKKIQCPDCGYTWVPGYSENEVLQLEEQEKKGIAWLEKAKEDIDRLRHFIEECEEYQQSIKRFKALVDNFPRLRPLWDVLMEKEALYVQPASHAYILDIWTEDVKVALALEDIRQKLSDLRNAKEQLEKSDLGNTHYEEHALSIEKKITEKTDYVSEVKEQVNALKSLRAELDKYSQGADTLARLESEFRAIGLELSKAIKNDALAKIINNHHEWLGRLQNEIMDAKINRETLKDIDSQLTKAEHESEVLKILVDELSPTEGLIAEQLMGFINCLVEQMNAIIASIWTYEMEILPCNIKTEELDYEFPLLVKNSDYPSKDVSEASSSQVDIINFAFKLVARTCLGLVDSPLLLDELAPSLDEQHRINIMHYVRQLVELQKCSQLFMISHYQQAHGAFNNAEYCVMDEANVTLPSVYNKHVLMK